MYIQLFSGTHWDREWYQDFQGFRIRLVKMIDALIDGLENNEKYGVFHFDGQSIVLSDYLEIMPENRERLSALMKSGKIEAGPWYCMPDEFLVSGESLIKNLQMGEKLVRSMGAEPLKYGYICDIFGHIAQMPQIFSQLGIHHACLGRGTNEHTTPMHFRWKSPDGSEVTAFKLQDSEGYCAFTSKVLKYFNEAEPSDEELEKRIKEYVDYEINRSNAPFVILMDSSDHTDYHPLTAKYVDMIKRLYPDATVSQNSVTKLWELLAPYEKELPELCGEFIQPAKVRAGYLHLITNTLSSRYPIKQYNDRVQECAEKVIAPLYALGLTDLPYSYKELIDKYIIENHPHDSICCCGIDKVYEDMKYRFAQAESISNEILHYFTESISENTGDNIKMLVYNPLPYAYKGGIELSIEFPLGYKPTYHEPFGYETLNSFKIYDDNGKELPYSITDIKKNHIKRVVAQTKGVNVYKVALDAELIPMGITEFTIKPFENCPRYLEKMPQSEAYAENDHIRLDIANDGRVNITDKKTGEQYFDLLKIVDDGEIGDGWYHCNPACDVAVCTYSDTSVRKILSGTDRAVFEIRTKMNVPENMVFGTKNIKRSEKNVDIPIIHTVTLQKSAEYLDIKTEIDNRAKDHRMRLKIATGISGDEYFANQAFCFVKRKAGIDVSTAEWKESEPFEKNMGGIIMKQNKKRALAFVSMGGLHEAAVHENGDMYITLFRGHASTVMAKPSPEGEVMGKMEFSYRIVPSSDMSFAQLQRLKDVYSTGFVTSQGNGDAKKRAPYLTLLGENAVFSTAEKSNGGMNVRIYQDSDKGGTATISLGGEYLGARSVDLEGNTVAEEKIENGKVTLSLKPWEIRTVLLERDR